MKNVFTIKAVLAATCSALLLSACGGGGGTVSASNGSGSGTASGTQITGKAIDGYLSGAKVCLDINDNGVCDPSEPSTTTADDGSYSLPVNGSIIGKKLLVVVTPTTKDKSRPGYVFPAEFTLSHIVAGTTEQHVTPLTTMVAAQMEAGMSRSEAERAVGALLGGNIDLKADYIAGKDSNTAAFASKVVDKVVVFAKSGRTDPATVRAVLNAIMGKGNIDLVGQADVDDQAKRPVFSSNVDALAALTGELFVYDGTETSSTSTVPVREHWYLTSAGLRKPQQKYVSQQWTDAIPGEFDQNYGEYRLKPDGSWTGFISHQDMEKPFPVQRGDSSNTLVGTDPNSDIVFTLEYRVAQIAGKSLSDAFVGWVDDASRSQLAGVFPAGSEAYVASVTRNVDDVTLASFSSCTPNAPLVTEGTIQHCNYIGNPTTNYTSVDQVFGLDVPMGGASRMRLAADGTAEVLDWSGKVLVGSSKVSWKRYDRNPNVLVINISLADAITGNLSDTDLLRSSGKIVIALHNGHLKRGALIPASVQDTLVQFKQSIFDQLFAELNKLLTIV
ncbi:hypothetical protein OL229_03975 [Neisseriaceae bacterium JH1-16]|nr:hypothetical protein [Neisseriaceae bacterium JH1-16]